jgi:hypothetical protein
MPSWMGYHLPVSQVKEMDYHWVSVGCVVEIHKHCQQLVRMLLKNGEVIHSVGGCLYFFEMKGNIGEFTLLKKQKLI